MSRRKKLLEQIRFEVSASPAVQRAFDTGELQGANAVESIQAMTLWIAALQNAILTLADELDAVELAAGEP